MIKQINVDQITETVALINSAYRGETSQQGWTTEAALLEGTRTSIEDIQCVLDHPTQFLFGYFNDQQEIIGTVFLELKESYVYLGMLTVKPTLQDAGIGKELMHFAESFAIEHQLSSIRMTVIEARKELIAYYERRGYRLTGETEPWIDGIHIGIRKQPIRFVVMEKSCGI